MPAAAPPLSRRVVAYFPLWIRGAGYSENDIDFSIVTHVAHFAVVPRPDGSIQIPDWGPFPDPKLIARTHSAGARISLVVGGDHADATAGFATMSADPATRRLFIQNLLTLVTTNGYDGVDLDWEFPNSDADRDHLTALVGELRQALGPDRLLSLTAPATDWWGRWYDVAALMPNLDWLGAMTYSLSGPSWSEHADHSAPLYASRDGEASVVGSVAYYTSRGVPADRLLVGLPFYGERFDDATALHQELAGKSGGAVDYPDVTRLVSAGWTLHRDPVAEVPYLVRDGAAGIITYDDAASIAAKCAYVTDKGLGGAIVWHLGKDRVGSAQPLLEAAAGCRA